MLTFRIGSTVLDTKSLQVFALWLCRGLISAITAIIALTEEPVTTTTGAQACALTAQQLAGVIAAMLSRNASCAYNASLSEILQL